jgi:ribosome assembly protein 4
MSKSSKRPRDELAAPEKAAEVGSIVAQFVSAEGERAGPQLDVPLDTTPEQLALILNQLLQNDEPLPYSFYVNDNEMGQTLANNILATHSTEQTLSITYHPQAVFRVRAVTRCSSTLPGHAEAMLSTSFSPSGKTLATGSGDHTVRLWDVHTEMPFKTLSAHRSPVLCIAWSPCGRFLVSGSKEGMLAIWSPSQTEPLRTIPTAHKKWINFVAWEPLHANPESTRFVSCGKDGTVRLWDRVSGQSLGTLSGHTNSVTCVRWGGDDLLYTGSHDRTVKVWGASTQKLVKSLEGHGHWVNCLALNTDAALRSGAYDHRGLAPESAEARVKTARERYEKVKGSGCELLASGSDDFTLFLWKPAEAKKAIARLTGHVQLINNAAFSPDGAWLASGSFDGAVRIWHGRTGKFVATLRNHVGAVYQLAWSSDSRLLASGSKDSTVKVWEVKTKKLLEDLPGHADEVYAVDWSPDGERVASGGKDRNLKLWRR